MKTSNPVHPTLRLAAGVALASLLLVACASTPPPPTTELAVSAAAVAHAAGAGAPVGAPSEMRMARDKLARANAAVTNKDNELARTLALEATADAQLAEAKTESGKARKAADEVADASRVLREELDRKPK